MTPTDFAATFHVPRETLERLQAYEALLRKWNPVVNLVSKTTLADVWTRHFADSAQLFPLLPPGTQTLTDIGSGAGFPGMVLAILGVPHVNLVESDQTKATFLREVARVTGAPATVHASRIEAVELPPADVVSARALADLSQLLPWALRLLKPGGTCIFPKGRSAADELTGVADSWTMRTEAFPSRTDPAGTILRLSDISAK
ncbi:16S rRNA (guanine(527)-N(7))-methyltransferase RsmG [Aerophototrophica crusticola]|uniref:Ribosomal RNA small subunit methyltransferase G n=1 Tax=Aerophototrophica crusticola TaxID=1709002 RepID=A0A858RAG7_9PROT|nr:16S rRNA (guanine(527)-N(7))-methyltransferase RsmG [Rhodospirillaceae bacterium B3]